VFSVKVPQVITHEKVLVENDPSQPAALNDESSKQNRRMVHH
jgi:uncharacterized protein YecE (DUF72 family)